MPLDGVPWKCCNEKFLVRGSRFSQDASGKVRVGPNKCPVVLLLFKPSMKLHLECIYLSLHISFTLIQLEPGYQSQYLT